MAHKEHEQLKISQKAIIYNPEDKKFLVVKSTNRKRQEDLDHLGWWEFVGGRIDSGEDNRTSLLREIQEEVGNIECDLLDVVDANLLRWADKKIFVVGYLVIFRNGEIVLSDEHSEYRWETAEEVEKNDEYNPWTKRFVKAAVERLREREYLNDLRRLQADFENYKKRQQESQKELAGYLIERLVMDLIPVLDNFRMATNHVPEASKSDPWVVGIQYIEKQLEDVLTANGMQVIEANVGDAFDPRVHEAVSQTEQTTDNRQPATNKEQETDTAQEKIVKVLQKGYKLGERVVRPVKVVVG